MLEDFKKSLHYISFLINHIQESLLLGLKLSLGYVICFVSVYTISCCLQCHVLCILCLYACTISYCFSSIYGTFFLLLHHKKGERLEKADISDYSFP